MHFPPGRAKEPWLQEYARMVLSKQGQDIISSMPTSDGFMPLDAEDLAEQTAKLK